MAAERSTLPYRSKQLSSRTSFPESVVHKKTESDQACTKRRYEITQADLPLSCPSRDERVWDAHPRVYLPIEDEKTGTIVCPYCSAEYVLKHEAS
jgi:uncharacterized Zn-finger protein